MGDKRDYEAVEIPDPSDSPYEDWDASQRRAWMLREMRDAGHPRPFTQADVARQFGVSPACISKDVKKIHEHIADDMGAAKIGEIIMMVENEVYELFEDDDRDPADTIEAAEKWADMLADYGAVERAPDRHEVEADVEKEVDASLTVTWDTVEDDGE